MTNVKADYPAEPTVAVDIDSAAYSRMLDAMSTVVLLFNKQQTLCYINPAGEMMFAMSARHLVGMHFSQLIGYDAPMQSWLDEAFNTGHPFTRHDFAVQLFGHEEQVTLDMTVVPVPDPQREEFLVELIQVDRLLRISRDESRAAQQQATQDLLRGLAHEVKNPLGGLRGAAQLLARQLSNDELTEYTRVIINEADRLQELVDRMIGPRTIVHHKEINLHEVLEHVRQLVLADSSHEIYIQRDYDPSIPDINADHGQLVQAVLNITRNAVQALGDKGEITYQTRILRNFTVGNERHKLVAVINIIDNGPGIDEALREKIFFPMVTGRAEGTGLGLSIAQTIVQQHKGLIECTSQPGETVFSILLPIKLHE